MAFRFSNLSTLALAATCAAPALAYTALVERWASDSGETRIMIEISSQALRDSSAPAGDYQQAGGSGGILSLSSMSNGFQMRFRDTSGSERCIGRMNLTSNDGNDRAEAVWFVDGRVEGYRCSTAGQTFRMNLNRIR